MKTKWYETLSALCAAAVLLAGVCACKGTADTEYVYVTDTTAPAAVTNINAQAGDGQVVLTWSDPADTDLYGVRVSYTSTGGASGNIRAAFTSGILVAKGAQTYIVTGLTNGTPYTFSVYTVDKSQNESTAAAATATPVDSSDKTAPAEALSFVAKAGDACATLSWEEPADSDYYGVKISATPAAGTLASPVVLLKGTTSLSVTGLTNAQSYTFTAQTLDTSLNASAGTTATTTPASSADTTPPADVTKLTAANKDAAVLLTWTDATATDVYGYEVSWNGTGAINRAALTAIPAGSMMVAQGAGGCYISNLVNSTSYTFTVKSVDTNGNKSKGVTAEITPAIITQSPLSIACAASITVATNQDITVTVSVSTAAGSSVQKVAYITGISYSAANVISSGTAITADENGAYTFTVKANGTYTAAALDTAGREECAYITVNNIDKTAPAVPASLSAWYVYADKTLTVTWADPASADLDYVTVTYTAGTAVAVSRNVTAGTKKLVLSDVDADVSYSITISATDRCTNKSAESIAYTMTTKAGPAVSSVKVNRTRIATDDTNRTVHVTITGSNFDLISAQTEKTVYVRVMNGTTTVDSATVALSSIDTANGTFEADVSTASATSTTLSGTDLTVSVMLCGTADTTHTATVNVCGNAKLSAPLTLSTSRIAKRAVTSGETTTVSITGWNLDVLVSPKIRLYDSTGAEYTASATDVAMPTAVTADKVTITADVPVPAVDDTYTVKLISNGSEIMYRSSYSSDYGNYFDKISDASLQVYDVPVFTGFMIPNAGTAKQGSTVLARVRGKNFTAPDVTADSFSVTCGTASITSGAIAVVDDDRHLSIALTIPEAAGTYTVTLACGSSKMNATFTVKDSTGWAVGDIIGADGTKRLAAVRASAAAVKTTFTDAGIPAAAVIWGFNEYGVAIGVGLKQGSKLQWAPENTTGNRTRFTEIVCTSTSRTEAASTATFTGDTYGGDNWAEVCAADVTAVSNAAVNYPVFNYANTYTSKAATDLAGTACADGWYVPSVAELCALYKVKATVDTSIGYVSGAMQIGTDYYWSSSQESMRDYFAMVVNLSKDYEGGGFKEKSFSVRVIRTF